MKPMMIPALALFVALAAAGCSKPADAAFGEKVRAYLLANPEVLEEVADKLQEKKQAALVKGSTDAIRKHRAQLERDPRDFVANPGGTITVVEFFDYRCGYCKVAAPEITQLIRENPDVRFVFKEFPIFGQVSDTAARVSLTAAAKTKGLDLYSRMMAEKALDEAGIDRHLTAVGLDPAAVRKAAQHPDIDRQISEIRQLAQDLRIEGTPAFIVGDTMIPGADMNALRAAITVAKAGDLKRPG